MRYFAMLVTILALGGILCRASYAGDNPEVSVIRAARIYTVSGPVIKNGVIIVKDGRISAVGKDLDVPEGAAILEMPESSVIPGLIDAHSHLALWSDPSTEKNETVVSVTPDTHIIDAFDPLSQDIRKAVRAGVTTALIAPGDSNPIAGRASVVKFYPGPTKQWLLKKEAGLKLSVSNDTLRYDREPTSRPGMIAMITEHFDKARQYKSDTFDPKAIVLKRLVDRKMPAFISAKTPDEVITALDIIRQHKLKARLVGSRQGDEVADQIAKQKIPVIYPPMLAVSRDKDLKRPGKLAAAGVKLAFASNAPETAPADIRTSAILAAKYGLDRKLALKSITQHPAQILGVARRIGSIKKGRDADLVILSGDPLELTSVVQAVVINGSIVYKEENE